MSPPTIFNRESVMIVSIAGHTVEARKRGGVWYLSPRGPHAHTSRLPRRMAQPARVVEDAMMRDIRERMERGPENGFSRNYVAGFAKSRTHKSNPIHGRTGRRTRKAPRKGLPPVGKGA